MAGRAGIPVIRVIHVDDLRKNYRDVAAVRGLSFDVPPGQILGLVGPNGAGKTTTMRVIAGIIPPSGGVIEVAGHDVLKAPLQAKKALAYVPDDPALFGSLTVQEHLVLAARAYEVTDYRPRAEALLRRTRKTEPESYEFGDYRLDLPARKFTRKNEEIALSPKEFRLLELFVKRPGRALTRDEILNLVWGYDSFVGSRSIDRFVTTLRNKIEPDPHNPVYIHTVREIGYKFEPPQGTGS